MISNKPAVLTCNQPAGFFNQKSIFGKVYGVSETVIILEKIVIEIYSRVCEVNDYTYVQMFWFMIAVSSIKL